MHGIIRVGGLPTTIALHEAAALPIVNDEALEHFWVLDCLLHAVRERTGVVVLGPSGAGKTLAAVRTVRDWDANEVQRQKTLDHNYVPRRVIPLTTIRATDIRSVYRQLFQAAFKKAPIERTFHRNKTDEELRDDLITRCFGADNIGAFIIDEAQTLTPAAFLALRDLMAVSRTMCPTWVGANDAGEEVVYPGGIGVLLLGTMELAPKLQQLPDYARRWTRTETIGAIAEEFVPRVLRRFLKAFDTAATELGDEQWATLVTQVITRGREMTIATLHDLARRYLARACAEHANVTRVQDLPWDEGLFRQAAYELLGLRLEALEAA